MPTIPYRFGLLLLMLALCALAKPAFSQKAPILIRGTVLKANTTQPIRGASVLIVPGMQGKSADSLGRFLINISPNDTLLIRAIGYKPQLYIPTSRTAAELKPVIYLEEVAEVLNEVEISGRPSEKKIKTALNNMKRTEPNVTANPNPKPIVPESMPTTPVEPSALENPISFFSKQEREKRALKQILDRVEAYERYQKEKADYNRFFKDNRGFQR